MEGERTWEEGLKMRNVAYLLWLLKQCCLEHHLDIESASCTVRFQGRENTGISNSITDT